jgi:hypothetical protein
MTVYEFVKHLFPARLKQVGLLEEFEAKFVRVLDNGQKVIVEDYFSKHILPWLDERNITTGSKAYHQHSVVTIEIKGPIGSGKSVVMTSIANHLKEKFGVDVISPDLILEQHLTRLDAPAEWELANIKETQWVLSERPGPGPKPFEENYISI